MTKYKIAFGSDHAGFQLKNKLVAFLQAEGHSVKDFGTFSEESCDYPDYIHPVACAVEKQEYEMGIIICGSGNGAAMTANKHKHIRAALCWNPELAALAKQHNDANILAIPARFVSEEEASSIVQSFLNAVFEGGRHNRRISKINDAECNS